MQREKVSMFPYIVIIRLKREKEEEEQQKKESKENQPQNTKQKLFTKKESKNCCGENCILPHRNKVPSSDENGKNLKSSQSAADVSDLSGYIDALDHTVKMNRRVRS